MVEALLYLDPESKLSLQDQIRQRLVESIVRGVFPAGARLPSSRKLAAQLKVARNTVLGAYEQLIEDGLLESRERSGIFVSERVSRGRVGFTGNPSELEPLDPNWRSRVRHEVASTQLFQVTPEWQRNPYPFIDGYFDSSVYPTAQWREAGRLAMGSRIIEYGAVAEGSADDPALIEEIRCKMLPRRGISAAPDEILITAGEQNSLYLLTQLLCDRKTTVAMEEPGNPRLRQLLIQTGSRIIFQPLDEQGMVVDERLETADVLCVTPSHQLPTSVTMDNLRRERLLKMAEQGDQLVIENDFEPEHNFLGSPHPALRSMDRQQRVVYVSGLPKMLSPGLRIGFIVAAAPLIRELRKFRQMVIGRPSLLTQRTAALFLSLGHFDAAMARLHALLGKRWDALRQALNHYHRGSEIRLPTLGGSALWVQAPGYVPVERLVSEAARRGILIEPDTHYYNSPSASRNYYRMGVTSIPEASIREGVKQLYRLLQELSAENITRLDEERAAALDGPQLRRILAGATLHCATFYCDPCTIELAADGSMSGRAGHANEDQDSGEWWIEQDLYCRRWNSWSYGETGRFRVSLHGQNIRWWDPEDGHLVDSAIIETGAEQLDSSAGTNWP